MPGFLAPEDTVRCRPRLVARTIRAAAAVALLCTAVTAAAEPSATGPGLLERGRYLVEDVAACGLCHTTPAANGRPDAAMAQAGGRIFEGRGLRAVAPNIAPAPETGVGRWTEAQFADAMRNGRRPDGSRLGPPMPVEAYRGISDRDIAAMWAYLRSLPPVRNAAERSRFAFEPTRFDPPVTSVPAPPAGDPVRRGEYLAVHLAHCMDCHSPRIGPDRADPDRVGAGGRVFQSAAGPVPSRNITPHAEAGIGRWSDEQIARALTDAVAPDGRRLSTSMSNRAPGWARMTGRDMADLLAYLRALAPQP
jgi:mono/diheme cytochrome c family protein